MTEIEWPSLGDLADRADRVLIGREIALGVGEGPRRLAEHVEAGGEARDSRACSIRSIASSMVRPMTKISPIIRIAAPTAWRTNGSPARRDQPLQRARLLALADQRAADHQPPGRGVDQGGIATCPCARASRHRRACRRSAGRPSPGRARAGTPRRATAGRRLPDVFSRYSWRNWLTQPRDWAARSSASMAQRAVLDPPARIGSRARRRCSSGFSTSGSGARCSRRSRLGARAMP